MKNVLFIILSCLILPCVSGKVCAAEIVQHPELAAMLDESGYDSGFALLDPQQDKIWVSNSQAVQRPLIPASTFKIVHSLIALDTGVHRSIDSMIKWDGRDRGYAPWNRDLTLEQAVRVSAIWYFEETARRIGRERISKKLKEVKYTNGDTSGPGIAFWLDGKLRVTALEQVFFLQRLYEGRLPFSKEDQKAVREILILEKKPEYVLSGKTGWAQRVTPQVGWLVGRLMTEDGLSYYYATYITSPNPDKEFSKARFRLTKKCLRVLGVMQ